MAKLTFHMPNGEQLAFRLFTDRRLRIGRERGNDIVLRDARVSRSHAEISFERGFFIVRDLGSSNGTFVNGREVKVAPLTEGSEIRIGSSVGRFSEELSEGPPPSGGPRREDERPDDYAAEPRREPPVFEPDYDDEPGHTKKHPKIEDPNWDYHRESIAPWEAPTDELPDPAAGSHDDATKDLGSPLDTRPVSVASSRPLRWTVERSDTGRSILSDEDERKIYFEAPWDAIGLFASFTAIAMLIAGFGAALAFTGRGEYAAAAVSAGITLLFVFTVMQIVPRRDIDLYEDESMNQLWIALRQETRSTFPKLHYSAREPDGNPFAHFRKSFWSNLGRRTWEISDRSDLLQIAEAREEASLRTWARKFIGAVSAGLVTDFVIRSSDDVIGRVIRHAGAIYRSVVEIDRVE
ncbi:MAG: FHA domain-containing protein, partial [Thermoanaerobaculia bacterium]|nr:FHA domain-containing protein [Thermoanaerobaculia bacterium]